jgi:hypothetical protein
MTNSTQEPTKLLFTINGQTTKRVFEATSTQTMPEEWEKRFIKQFFVDNGEIPVQKIVELEEFIREERSIAKSQERDRILRILKQREWNELSKYGDTERYYEILDCIESLQKEGEL